MVSKISKWYKTLFSGRRATWTVLALLAMAVAGLLLIGLTVLASGGRPAPPATPTLGPGPSILVSPVEGEMGTPVTVTGQDWQPGDTVFVRLENSSTSGQETQAPIAFAIVAEDGHFTAGFTFPSDPRWIGSAPVSIVAWSPATGAEARGTFQVLAPTQTPTPEPTATSTATPIPPTPTATFTPTPVVQPTATPIRPTATPARPTATPTPAFVGWRGEYYGGRDLAGAPALVRDDSEINFDWGTGAPATGLPADGFSARWTRTANFEAATYRFFVRVDDGARLWVDDQVIVDTWRDGGVREVSAEQGLTKGAHRLRVEYYERTGEARIRVWWKKVASPAYPDWKGEYWSNRRLEGSPKLVRNDQAIDFRWGRGAAAVGLPEDDFSARWSRQVGFDGGVYRFYAVADDGVRLYVGDRLVLDEWHASSGEEVYAADLALTGSQRMVVEYYERGGEARVQVWWKRVGDPPTPTVPPTATPTLPPTATPVPPTPTPTVTLTPTPVTSPTVVLINEVLPVPAALDWDGDGTASEGDEWIELINGGTGAVDLGGWFLDDGEAGSDLYRIPGGTILQPGAFRVFFRRETGLMLDDAGDQVRLLGPEGAVVDVVVFGALSLDASYSRDAGGTWHADWPPSPGAPNLPPAPGGSVPGVGSPAPNHYPIGW